MTEGLIALAKGALNDLEGVFAAMPDDALEGLIEEIVKAARIDGAPLRYARPDPWLPDLIVCHPDLAEAVLAAVRDSGVLEEG